jgi:gamma-glutamylcyclotransferase (GGCT)/AIG2-like uncharacterized protein YtfP
VLRVDELPKLGGVPCAKLVPTGCGIYATRPAVCRGYRCMWLQGGLEEEDRPDRLGAVIDAVVEDGVQRLSIRQKVPGIYDSSPRLQAIVGRYREQMPVKLSSASLSMDPDAPFRIFLAEGEEQRIAGEEIEVWRNGELVRRERLPWLERGLRRASLAWQRWRLARLHARPSPYMPGPGGSVFCYGTLLFPEVLRAVAGVAPPPRSATARGWGRYRVHGEVFPGVIAQPGASTRGAVFDGIDAPALARLDAFEGELYQRVPLEVELDDGTRATAWCWVMAPGREAVLTREPWDPEDFAARELASYLRQVRELGTPYRSR